MALTVALGGDTMLGRSVAEERRCSPAADTLFPPAARQALTEADPFVLNLECRVLESAVMAARGWPSARRPARGSPVSAPSSAPRWRYGVHG